MTVLSPSQQHRRTMTLLLLMSMAVLLLISTRAQAWGESLLQVLKLKHLTSFISLGWYLTVQVSLWHLHRKESSSLEEFIARLMLKFYTAAHYSAPLVRILLIGIIILGVTKEGWREIVRCSESFCPNSIVLVVVLKMVSTDGRWVFLIIRPIAVVNKLSIQMNPR